MVGNLKSNRATWPCLGGVAGWANVEPKIDMRPSLINHAILDATDCLPVDSTPVVGTNRTQVSTVGYNAGFQSGIWQLEADCTTLSASWLNSDGTRVPMLPAYDLTNNYPALFGGKDAFRAAFFNTALLDMTLQLTSEGYVKVLRPSDLTYYIAKTFGPWSTLTRVAAEAEVFTFTTSV
jgi:hypothetical protein